MVNFLKKHVGNAIAQSTTSPPKVMIFWNLQPMDDAGVLPKGLWRTQMLLQIRQVIQLKNLVKKINLRSLLMT